MRRARELRCELMPRKLHQIMMWNGLTCVLYFVVSLWHIWHAQVKFLRDHLTPFGPLFAYLTTIGASRLDYGHFRHRWTVHFDVSGPSFSNDRPFSRPISTIWTVYFEPEFFVHFLWYPFNSFCMFVQIIILDCDSIMIEKFNFVKLNRNNWFLGWK